MYSGVVVFHYWTIYEVIHVYYFVVPKVFSDRTIFFGYPRVVLCRRQSFSRPDRVSRNPRVLLRCPRGFSGPDIFGVIHVYYFVVPWVSHDQTMFLVKPRVLRRRPRGFSRPTHVSSNPRVLRQRPHERTVFLAHLHVSFRRHRSFSRPDHVSSNPCVRP